MISIGYYSESEGVCNVVNSRLELPFDAQIVNETIVVPELIPDEYVKPEPKFEWMCYEIPFFFKTFCKQLER